MAKKSKCYYDRDQKGEIFVEIKYAPCVKCGEDIPVGSVFCNFCGWKQSKKIPNKRKKRPNGAGSVYKTKSGSWEASVTLGYKTIDNKYVPVRNKKAGFRTATEAYLYIPFLFAQKKVIDLSITLKGLYDLWLPTHDAGNSTIAGYKSAFNHFKPIWYLRFNEISIDDLQECIDDCEQGKRTRQLMKIVANLIYKYAVPRGYQPDNLNLAAYLKTGEGKVGVRPAFTELEVEKIRLGIGVVPFADYIYCMIYTGYRPFEFLLLDIADYRQADNCFVGGGKTEAGTNRIVPVSEKIRPIVERLISDREYGPIFCNPETSRPFNLRPFREDCFYPALKQLGIDQANVKLTPYSTRHTFASLLEKVQGMTNTKLELMGHADEKMLLRYTHADNELRRKVINGI